MLTHSFTNSTMISGAQYDPETKVLTVIFARSPKPNKSNVPVPQSIYEALIKAPSAGRYYNAEIVGKYGMVKA